MIESFQHAVRVVRHFEMLRGRGDQGHTDDARELVRRTEFFASDSFVQLDQRGQWLVDYALQLQLQLQLEEQDGAASKGAA